MELRGQDMGIGMPISLGYNPPIRETSSKLSPTSIISTTGVEKRRDGTGNGTEIINPSQILDHHHLHHHRQHQQQQNRQVPPPPPQHNQQRDPEPDPDPDPVPVSIAVAGVTGAPVTGGSNPRTPTTKTAVSVRYRECLKNHAASIGGHVVDGCGEFMPSGEERTPEALKCAACDCHRNFHRKEVVGEPQSGANCYYCYNPHNRTSSGRSMIPPPPIPPSLPPPPLQQHHKFSLGLPTSPPMMMTFGGGGGATESSSEDLNVYQSNAGASQPPPPPFSVSKKRFRTKFSQEQKEKMLEFAEKVGWRIQKQDEPAVQQFCAEVGIKRQVLKVWMHNNKHSMKKEL